MSRIADDFRSTVGWPRLFDFHGARRLCSEGRAMWLMSDLEAMAFVTIVVSLVALAVM
jgi:hypothetical protein